MTFGSAEPASSSDPAATGREALYTLVRTANDTLHDAGFGAPLERDRRGNVLHTDRRGNRDVRLSRADLDKMRQYGALLLQRVDARGAALDRAAYDRTRGFALGAADEAALARLETALAAPPATPGGRDALLGAMRALDARALGAGAPAAFHDEGGWSWLRADLLDHARPATTAGAWVALGTLDEATLGRAGRALLADFLVPHLDARGRAEHAARRDALEVLMPEASARERTTLGRAFVRLELALARDLSPERGEPLAEAIGRTHEAIAAAGLAPLLWTPGSNPGGRDDTLQAKALLGHLQGLASRADLSQIERFAGYEIGHGREVQYLIDTVAAATRAANATTSAATDDPGFTALLQERTGRMGDAENGTDFRNLARVNGALASTLLGGSARALELPTLMRLYQWVNIERAEQLPHLGIRDDPADARWRFAQAWLGSARADRLAYLGLERGRWNAAEPFLADVRTNGIEASLADRGRFGMDDLMRTGLALGMAYATGNAVTGGLGSWLGGGAAAGGAAGTAAGTGLSAGGAALAGAGGGAAAGFVSALVMTEGDIGAAVEAGVTGALASGLTEYVALLEPGLARTVGEGIIAGATAELSGESFAEGLMGLLTRELGEGFARGLEGRLDGFVADFTGQLVAVTIREGGDAGAIGAYMERYVTDYAADYVAGRVREGLFEAREGALWSTLEGTTNDLVEVFLDSGGDFGALRAHLDSPGFLAGVASRAGLDVTRLAGGAERFGAQLLGGLTTLAVASGGDPEAMRENAPLLALAYVGDVAGARVSGWVDAATGTPGSALGRVTGSLMQVALASDADPTALAGVLFGELSGTVTSMLPAGAATTAGSFSRGLLDELVRSYEEHGGDLGAVASDLVAYAAGAGVAEARTALAPPGGEAAPGVAAGEGLGVPDPTLEALAEVGYGDRGPAVAALQRRLAALGHDPGAVDGHFGPATGEALAAFQAEEIEAIDASAERERAAFGLEPSASMREWRAGLVAERGAGGRAARVGRHTLASLASPVRLQDPAAEGAAGEAGAGASAGGGRPSVEATLAFIRATIGGETPSSAPSSTGAPGAASGFVPEGVESEFVDTRAALVALERHSPMERRIILADLSVVELDAWVEDLNTLEAAEVEHLLKVVVEALSGDTLALFYARADEELKAAYVRTVNAYGSAEAQERFVDVTQRAHLRETLGGAAAGGSDAALLLDAGQMALDVVGMFDPTFLVDGVNGVVSLLRGDWLGAGISAAAMIPFIGDAAKVGKLGRWAQTTETVIERALADSGFRRLARPVLERISEALGTVTSAIWEGRDAAEGAALKEIKRKLDELLGAVEVDGLTLRVPAHLVAGFASVTSGTFGRWKADLLAEGYSRAEIAEIVYQGSLARGENIWGDNGWGKYLAEITLTTPPGRPYHAHHLVQKGNLEPSVASRKILEDANINPLLGRENLMFAPQHAVGQHGIEAQEQLYELLLAAKGDPLKVRAVLVDWAIQSAYRE